MILLTHKVDLDGLGPIILSKANDIQFNNIIMVSYDEDIKTIVSKYANKKELLVITDFRLDESLFSVYKENFNDFLVFDHHEETLQFKKKENVFVDIERSGTKIFYDEFIKDSKKTDVSDYLVNLINTYDLWKKEHPLWGEANNLNRVLWNTMNYTYEDGDWKKYKLFINMQVEKIQKDFFRWTNFEVDKISYAKMKESKALKEARSILQIREDSKGKKFGLWFGRNKISLVCSRLMEDIPDLDYIININTYNGRKPDSVNGKVSVRSKDIENFDVTCLFGINGHKGAGGGEFSISFLTNLWKGNIIKQIPYKRNRSK